MKTIKYLKGDATLPQASGIKIIAHICNNIGGWGKGFVLAISERWSEPEKAYREWYRNRAKNDFALGNIQFVQAEPYIYVASQYTHASHWLRTGGRQMGAYRAIDRKNIISKRHRRICL